MKKRGSEQGKRRGGKGEKGGRCSSTCKLWMQCFHPFTIGIVLKHYCHGRYCFSQATMDRLAFLLDEATSTDTVARTAKLELGRLSSPVQPIASAKSRARLCSKEVHNLLQQDALDAMRWCLEKDRHYHKVFFYHGRPTGTSAISSVYLEKCSIQTLHLQDILWSFPML